MMLVASSRNPFFQTENSRNLLANLSQNLSGSNPPAVSHRQVLALALPIILSNVSVPLVGMVDTAVMGRMSEPTYIGATAIGAVIFSSVFWLFGFLRMGTGGLVAQAFGGQHLQADNRADAAASGATEVDNAIARALLSALCIGLLLVILQKPIIELALKAFTASDELKQLVRDYCSIRMFAAPATLVTYALLGAFIGLQRTAAVLTIQLLLNLVNIALTIGFFSIFDWGIKGVALATLIAEYVAVGYGLLLLQRSGRLFPLKTTWQVIVAPQAIRELIEVNGNLFVRTLCLTLAFYWLTQSGSMLGEVTLAANAILIHMLHLMAHALDGFSHAAETLCGYAYGQKNRSKFKSSVRTSSLWAMVFACLITIAYGVFGTQIVALMTTLEEVRAHAGQWLPLIALTPLISVWSFLLDGIYIGTTHTREMRNGMIVSLLVFLASNLILVHFYGNTGLWISYIVLMVARTLTLYHTYPRILSRLGPAPASASLNT